MRAFLIADSIPQHSPLCRRAWLNLQSPSFSHRFFLNVVSSRHAQFAAVALTRRNILFYKQSTVMIAHGKVGLPDAPFGLWRSTFNVVAFV